LAGGGIDEVFAELSPRLAHTISQKDAARLNASARGHIRVGTGGDGLEAAIADCERVYRTGWQSAERYQGFLPGLMRACANQGWLRLGILSVDGEPAAVQFWRCWPRCAGSVASSGASGPPAAPRAGRSSPRSPPGRGSSREWPA
jgi:hypothetical protein